MKINLRKWREKKSKGGKSATKTKMRKKMI